MDERGKKRFHLNVATVDQMHVSPAYFMTKKALYDYEF